MASDDAATIKRVITHMNSNHQDALDDYARFYARLSPTLASTATLSTLSLRKLTLTVTSPHGVQSNISIPISPPLASLAELRERLSVMAFDAMEGLGKSQYKVQRWVAPGFGGSIVCAAVAFGYWSFWNSAREFSRGGWVREYIFRGHGGPLVDLLQTYGHVLFWVVVAVHVLEAVWIHRSRLGKHAVETGSALWWKWILMTFAEGVGSVKRFDAEVRRLEEHAKGGKGH